MGGGQRTITEEEADGLVQECVEELRRECRQKAARLISSLDSSLRAIIRDRFVADEARKLLGQRLEDYETLRYMPPPSALRRQDAGELTDAEKDWLRSLQRTDDVKARMAHGKAVKALAALDLWLMGLLDKVCGDGFVGGQVAGIIEERSATRHRQPKGVNLLKSGFVRKRTS